ncbi:MAG TPA: transglutaminase family protein [Planctomycetota bacterium]|nr:transglutaminase family protein [Planctomycetota bacterium]
MLFQIQHTLRYTYDAPVALEPAVLRLTPRSDAGQQLITMHCKVSPEPAGQSACVDLDGNQTVGMWFAGQSDFLAIVTASEVRTLRTNPFDFLLMPASLYQLPMGYPPEILAALMPYLLRSCIAPELDELAGALVREAGGDTVGFLTLVCSRLAVQIHQQPREAGGPHDAWATWQAKIGACRDVSVLFMELCRSVGLASRFVSGYVLGILPHVRPELHAWVEVYLPGAGWRGFDPSMGVAVSDRHVAVAGSAQPENAAPLSGTYRRTGGGSGGAGGSNLWYEVNLRAVAE